MTRDKLVELNAISNDIDVLERLLGNIKTLRDLNTHCNGGFNISGSDFRHAKVVKNLCDKFEPIVKEELERLNSDFRSA